MTAKHRPPLEQDSASTAGGMITHNFRASQTELFPDDVGQRPSWLKLKTVHGPVDLERDRADGLPLSQRHDSRLAVTPPYGGHYRPSCSGSAEALQEFSARHAV